MQYFLYHLLKTSIKVPDIDVNTIYPDQFLYELINNKYFFVNN